MASDAIPPEPEWANWLAVKNSRPFWRRMLLPALILAALGAGGWFAYQFFFPSPSLLPNGRVASAKITLSELPGQQKELSVAVTDRDKIDSLLRVLRQAQVTSDHKCGDSGVIEFELTDGTSVHLGILAGHDKRFYEYRAYRGSNYDMFRVDRESLERALGDLGVVGLDQGDGK